MRPAISPFPAGSKREPMRIRRSVHCRSFFASGLDTKLIIGYIAK